MSSGGRNTAGFANAGFTNGPPTDASKWQLLKSHTSSNDCINKLIKAQLFCEPSFSTHQHVDWQHIQAFSPATVEQM